MKLFENLCRIYKENKSVLCVALYLNTCVNNVYIRANLPTYEHCIPEQSVYQSISKCTADFSER